MKTVLDKLAELEGKFKQIFESPPGLYYKPYGTTGLEQLMGLGTQGNPWANLLSEFPRQMFGDLPLGSFNPGDAYLGHSTIAR